MANVVYDNFYLSNEVEDQFDSHLDLMRFCTVDRTLEGTAGMKRLINVYTATNGTEKLAMGEGNTKSIEVGHTQREYNIELAQNRFDWKDEEAMKDPMLVPVGMKHAGTDMFNTVNGDVFGEFEKASLSVEATAFNFDAFADAVALLGLPENEEVEVFGWVSRKAKAAVRKALKDELKYVEAFARHGYIGTVCGVNLYDKANAKDNEICIGTKKAVTAFTKKGTEVEVITKNTRSAEDANVRKNTAFSRKYYVVALTDETQAAKIVVGG
jgi:hypothetical protein